ncbi:hypothetical protein [Chryseobacterium sp. MEBOG07]|uniref:hypothetical protein n=1 Tax=Chryseobacterium sp. MEBOG07 TaxID=2879939 RepID=UPI001F3300A0|nr:hypothetical protein [Chryseobacterium sp. MEBOG07]UKB79130.1 hypothetical protein LF886_22310 [Chryseobacterium sp. MEBOG07]
MKIYLISFVISLLITSVSTVVTYHIIDGFDPAVTEDGRRYMPTENIVKSLFLSFVLGAFVFITSVKIQRKKQKK